MGTRKSKAAQVLEELAGGRLSVGSYLRSIREGEEASQVQFAAQLGISKSHLCDIEKGRKSVAPVRAAELARLLGYSERQFVQLALQDAMEKAGLPYKVTIDAA